MVVILREPAAAEDATQEAFIRAFKNWKHWKEEAPAEAWLHRIALNTAFSHLRRERLRKVEELIKRLGRPAVPDPTASEPDLVREIRALPQKQAAALILRHLHGYTNREIAQSLGVPEQTIASRLAAAKARLRERLGDQIAEQMVTSQGTGVFLDE